MSAPASSAPVTYTIVVATNPKKDPTAEHTDRFLNIRFPDDEYFSEVEPWNYDCCHDDIRAWLAKEYPEEEWQTARDALTRKDEDKTHKDCWTLDLTQTPWVLLEPVRK